MLTTDGHDGRVYELAGDEAYTLAEFAAEVSAVSGKAVAYRNLPEAEFKTALIGAGLPEGLAGLLADSDMGASKGGLNDESRQLSRLMGRPTTPYRVTIAQTMARIRRFRRRSRMSVEQEKGRSPRSAPFVVDAECTWRQSERLLVRPAMKP